MELTLCIMLLSVAQERTQFFQYSQISLSCWTGCGGWTLKRNTSKKDQQSHREWSAVCEASGTSCTIQAAYPSDTGVYWCESQHGKRSNIVNITVTDGAVILESPALPVMEGDNVTLRCSYKGKKESNFSAPFYKDGVYIGSKSAGTLIISNVSKSDEGFYKCRHPSQAESPQSWLSVQVRHQPVRAHTSPRPTFLTQLKNFCILLLAILYISILVLCLYAYRKWQKDYTAKI